MKKGFEKSEILTGFCYLFSPIFPSSERSSKVSTVFKYMFPNLFPPSERVHRPRDPRRPPRFLHRRWTGTCRLRQLYCCRRTRMERGGCNCGRIRGSLPTCLEFLERQGRPGRPMSPIADVRCSRWNQPAREIKGHCYNSVVFIIICFF